MLFGGLGVWAWEGREISHSLALVSQKKLTLEINLEKYSLKHSVEIKNISLSLSCSQELTTFLGH